MINSNFVFVNNENYYLISFGDYIFINSYKFKNDKLVKNKVDKKVIEYFKFYENLSLKDRKEYIFYLKRTLDYHIPKAKQKFGEKFCNMFINDYDKQFLYQDKYAKHFILNFKEKFFKQPKIFPFYISYLDVWISEDYKIFKNNQEISVDDVFRLYDKYKTNLTQTLIKKNKIYLAIEKRIKKQYFLQKKFLNSQKMCDFNLEIEIKFFDIAENVVFIDFCNKYTFNSVYDFNNIPISRLFWHLIDKFGIRIITAKLKVWSEIKSDLQMFYNI